MYVAVATNQPKIARARTITTELVTQNGIGVNNMSNLINDNYGCRSDDQSSLLTVTQTAGPAIDDEMAANYAAKLLTDVETTETGSTQTKDHPRIIDPTPVFDPESMQAMFASLGPAIDDPTYGHDWQ